MSLTRSHRFEVTAGFLLPLHPHFRLHNSYTLKCVG